MRDLYAYSSSVKFGLIKGFASIFSIVRVFEGHEAKSRRIASNPNASYLPKITEKVLDFGLACISIKVSNINLAPRSGVITAGHGSINLY